MLGYPLMKSSLSKYNRVPSALLGLALLLVVLGIGNVSYGGNKAAHYGSVVLTAERELSKPKKPVFPLVDPALSVDREQQHLQRLRGSYHFYIFVRRAGIVMFLLGLVLVLPSIFYVPAKENALKAPKKNTKNSTIPL